MESCTCFSRANVRLLKLAVPTHAMPSVALVFNFSPACEVGLLCPEVPAGAVDLIPSVCVHLICCCKGQNRLNYLFGVFLQDMQGQNPELRNELLLPEVLGIIVFWRSFVNCLRLLQSSLPFE